MPDHPQADRLAELVETALELPADQRAAYTQEACAGDGLAEPLLRHHDQIDGFMETPAFAVSGAVPSSLDNLDLTAAPEFRAFLDTIDARGPTGLQVPLILENAPAAIHQTRLGGDWLRHRPRFHLPLAPTSSS